MIKKTEQVTEVKAELLPAEATKENGPLIRQAQAISITDNDSYNKADVLRFRLKNAKKSWTDRLAQIIRPQYEALESLYSLQREIVNPIDKASVIITEEMRRFKLEEKRIADEAQAVRDRLQRDAEEATRRLEAAKSKSIAALAKKQIANIEEKLEQTIVAPVVAGNSGSRNVKMWRITDFKAFLMAVASGELPEDLVEVNSRAFNEYFRADDADKTSIRTWPGVVVEDDIQIVSKRS